VYIFEFKQSTDRDEGFLDVKDAEANEQHNSIISALKVAAPERKFEQIDFVDPYTLCPIFSLDPSVVGLLPPCTC